MKTYMAKNFDSGLIHAYRHLGNFYKRRCGTSGKKAFIQSSDAITTVSAEWFVKQSDACRKCKATFDLEDDTESRSRPKTGVRTDSNEVACPVDDCEYSGAPASVAAHVSGKKSEDHDWSKLGFDGAIEFKRLMNQN